MHLGAVSRALTKRPGSPALSHGEFHDGQTKKEREAQAQTRTQTRGFGGADRTQRQERVVADLRSPASSKEQGDAGDGQDGAEHPGGTHPLSVDEDDDRDDEDRRYRHDARRDPGVGVLEREQRQ